MLDKQTINNLIETVQTLYEADELPWMIGYSGGKDSTAVAQLVWMALQGLPEEKRTKPVYIMNTDTLVESPVIEKWVEKSLNKMEKAAAETRIPFIIQRLIPDYNDTFWVNFLGRGYPFPRKKFRWCTDRLKIRPVNEFIKKKISAHGEIILVLGTRKAESARRARNMEKLEKKRVRELLSPNPTLANEYVYSPLEDWSDDDVWGFLMQYENPWGYSNKMLLTLYRGATADQECPIMTSKDLPSCGKSRFGCWVCTMVERDRSMEAMITNDEEKAWLTPLLEFRNEFGNEDLDKDRRSFRRSSGRLQGNDRKLFHGPYLQSTREEWLKKLLILQKQIHETAPEEYQDLELITMEELREIRRIWVKEKHEFIDSVPRIYEEVFHKRFLDLEWKHAGNYGQEEWELLKETCADLFPEEELLFESLYSMVDLENSAVFNNTRASLIDDLDSVLSKTFYKNENDALAFYTDLNERKKNLGAKYNDKFLSDQNLPEEGQLTLDFDEGEKDVDI